MKQKTFVSCAGLLLVSVGLASCQVADADAKPAAHLPEGTIAALAFNPGPDRAKVSVPGLGNTRTSKLVLVNADPAKSEVFDYAAVDHSQMDYAGGKLVFADRNATYVLGDSLAKYPHDFDGERPRIVRYIPGTKHVLTAWNSKFLPDGYEYPFQVVGADKTPLAGDFGVLANGSALCGDTLFVESSFAKHDSKTKPSISTLQKVTGELKPNQTVMTFERPVGQGYSPAGDNYPCADGIIYQIMTTSPITPQYYLQRLNTRTGTGELAPLELASGQVPADLDPSPVRNTTVSDIWQGRLYWLAANVGKVYSCDLTGKDARVEFEVARQSGETALSRAADIRQGVVTVTGIHDGDKTKMFVRQYSLTDGAPIGDRIVVDISEALAAQTTVSHLVGTPKP